MGERVAKERERERERERETERERERERELCGELIACVCVCFTNYF
jgi:hypothetical protein